MMMSTMSISAYDSDCCDGGGNTDGGDTDDCCDGCPNGGSGTITDLPEFDIYYLDYYDFSDNPAIVYPEHGTYNNEFINLHTGQLTLKHEDITVEGAMIPVSLSHYYASLHRDSDMIAVANRYHCGNGWKLSAHQTIEEDTSDSATKYIYTDAAGKRHYFVEMEYGRLEDTGGLHLTMNSADNSISDRGGNTMFFDGAGRLIKITDRNGNQVTYTYENEKLVKATDSFGRETVLTYNGEFLSEIRDPQNRTVRFFYYGKDLRRIEEPDGKSSVFTYDSRHHITRVLNPDGVEVVYTYEEDSDRVVRTDKYATVAKIEHGTVTMAETESTESDEYNIFEYRGARSTAVTDRSGIRRVYIFDESGRVEVEYEDSLVNGVQEDGQVTAVSVNGYSDKKRVFHATSVAAEAETQNFFKNGTFTEEEPSGDGSLYGFDQVVGSGARVMNSCIAGAKSFGFSLGVHSKYLKQTVDITNDPDHPAEHHIKKGDSLLLSAWAKASAKKYENINTRFELRAIVHYTDNTSETITAAYDTEYTDWQYTALPIRPEADKTLDYISVYLDGSLVSSAVYFTGVRLVHALSEAVRYEEDLYDTITVFGKNVRIVQRVTSYDGITTTVTENNSLYLPVRVTVTDLDGNSFVSVNEYDEKGNCIAVQNYRGTVTLSDYTENGQVKKTRTYHAADFNTEQSLTCPADCFVKEYNYDKNGEYLKNETDARSADIRTQYDYDEGSGLINYVTDAGGVRTTYAYDHATKAMTMASTSVSGQNNSVAYGYTNRLLTAITHNGFEYRFEYDGFGRQTKITAGDHLLAANTYTLTDITEVTTAYATGEQVKVTTDRHQQPLKKEYTNESGTTTLVENEYDELGKVTRSVDNTADIVYTYTYDRRGNVTEETRNGSAFKSLQYDDSNRLTRTTVYTSDETLTYTPRYETRADGAIYTDNTLRGMTLSGVFEENVTRDEHRRPVHRSLKVGNMELLGQGYSYLKKGSRLTNVVKTVTRRINGFVKDAYHYVYDNNGNITEVYQQDCETCAEELLVQYKYDGLNRLVRENNYGLGKTYTYTYDAAGNILCKRTYGVTPSSTVPPLETKEYVYDTTGWKDQLKN